METTQPSLTSLTSVTMATTCKPLYDPYRVQQFRPLFQEHWFPEVFFFLFFYLDILADLQIQTYLGKRGCMVHSNVFVRSSVCVSLVHCVCDSSMVRWFPDDFTPVMVKEGHLEFLCSFFSLVHTIQEEALMDIFAEMSPLLLQKFLLSPGCHKSLLLL